ncbi:MAG: efflux RND transporter periplasmic adaptor subunit [Prevotellaceae bacterium]|nr:efflux RND transporter periplasmic adaptor subunit [Prevotellaceae bacterium]
MNYRKLTKIGIAFVVAICVSTLTGCKGEQAKQQASNEYAVRTIAVSSPELNYNYPATIKGKQDIEIRPRVAGNIIKVCVDEGASVKTGQTLFVIDDVTYREAVNQSEAAVNQAKAAVNQANAGLATAKLTYSNKKELLNKKIIGDYEFQTAQNSLAQAEAAVATAKASLASANAALVSARQNLSYCYVKSPANGVVGSIPYRVGALVSSSSAEPLTTVSNIETMYVYFSVTEKQLLEMTRTTGDSKAILASFPEVQLKLADGTVYEKNGKITTISGVIDQTTGSVSLRADFANPDRLLKTGGTATVLLPYTAKDVVVIPQSATVELQDQKYVYVVGQDNKVTFTSIQVADVNDSQNYIVTAGLKAGDRIVVQGVAQGISALTDGMEITPITEEQAAQKVQQAIQMGAADLSKKK